jgi:hypothetical protein
VYLPAQNRSMGGCATSLHPKEADVRPPTPIVGPAGPTTVPLAEVSLANPSHCRLCCYSSHSQALQVSLSQEEAEISLARRTRLLGSLSVVGQAFRSPSRTHVHRYLIAWMGHLSEWGQCFGVLCLQTQTGTHANMYARTEEAIE